jgi:uncharacterized protein (DUF433 family)
MKVPLDWRNYIVADRSVSAGKPVVRGTQITVESIINLLATGSTKAQVIEQFPYLSEPDIRACLAYAGEVLRERGSPLAGTESQPTPRISMEPMKVALRVLSAIVEKQTPSPADVSALMRLTGSEAATMSPDEIACEALQLVMRDRAEARKALTVR